MLLLVLCCWGCVVGDVLKCCCCGCAVFCCMLLLVFVCLLLRAVFVLAGVGVVVVGTWLDGERWEKRLWSSLGSVELGCRCKVKQWLRRVVVILACALCCLSRRCLAVSLVCGVCSV